MRRSKGTLYRPVTTRTVGGRKVKRKAAFYWARYVDADGGRRCHVLTLPDGGRITDKDVARSALDAILKRVEREQAGLIDRTLERAAIPFRKLLADYIRHLRRRRVSRKHVDQVVQSGKWFSDKSGIVRVADLESHAAAERIDKALGSLLDSGKSPRTANRYRALLHGLCEYASKGRVLTRNPVASVELRDERLDRRKVRRALTVEEAGRLLGVAGPRRAHYSMALWSGLRWGEIAALEWRDVDLANDRPAIRLRAEATKARRADVLPLHPDLAGVLADLREAAPFAKLTDRLFPTSPTHKTFRRDLDRARIAWRKDDHDDGASIDRHALRTTYVSWLEAAGVSGSAKRILARHAAVGVTERNYTDARLLDLWAEIRKLPAIPTASEPQALRATGTHGKASDAAGNPRNAPTLPRVRAQRAKGWIKPGTKRVALPVALHTGIRGVNVASVGIIGGSATTVTPCENAGKNSGFSAENASRREGLEPPTVGLEIRCSVHLSYRRRRRNRCGPGWVR